MPYITTAERIGKQQGLQQGITQGIKAILEIKFGDEGQELSRRAAKMKNVKTLKALMAKIKMVQNLSEAEKVFDELENRKEKSRS